MLAVVYSARQSSKSIVLGHDVVGMSIEIWYMPSILCLCPKTVDVSTVPFWLKTWSHQTVTGNPLRKQIAAVHYGYARMNEVTIE